MEDAVIDAPRGRGSLAGSEEALILPAASTGWEESSYLIHNNFILIKLNSPQHIIFGNNGRLFQRNSNRKIN